MIIWSENTKPEKDFLPDLESFIVANHKSKDHYFTTYHYNEGLDKNLKELLGSFYKDQIKSMMIDLGVHGFVSYRTSYWVQMYNSNTTAHNIHTHFGEDSYISWVHILNSPKQKCFFFVNSNGEKTYPEKQSNYDMFAFPSWALHGVDPVEEKDVNRIIVAGNIYFKDR